MVSLVVKLTKSRFFQNILTLASGTAIAQIIAILLMPVLSRLYSQDAFGLLTSYAAVVGVLSSFVTLKYDTALVLPKEDRDAYALLKLSNLSTIILTIFSVAILFIPLPFFEKYKGLQLFIGFGTLLSVNYNNSALWNIRFKSFRVTTVSRIIQALGVFFFQYILYFYFDYEGLIIGNILGVLVSGIYLVLFRKMDYKIYSSISQMEIKTQGKRYIDFPKYFTFSNFIQSMSANLPVLLFVNYISYQQLGLYGMAMTLIVQPVTLISGSFKSVILSYMAERKNNLQRIVGWYVKNIILLLCISLIGSVVILLFAEDIIRLFLGAEWEKTGVYIKMMIPLFIGMMIATPGIAATRVFEMQKYGLYYSIISLVVKLSTLLGLFYLEVEFAKLILIYSIINLVMIVVNNIILFLKIKLYETLLVKA